MLSFLIWLRFLRAKSKGLFSFQCGTSMGFPKTPPISFASGPASRRSAFISFGDSVISAGLCALTEAKTSGCATAAENSKKEIENRKKSPQALRRVKNRKGIESEFLDGLLD